MNFAYSPRVEALRQQLQAFMDDHIVPRIGLACGSRCRPVPRVVHG